MTMISASNDIAICISGEIRTALKAKKSFDRFFPSNADVFFHTWQEDLDYDLIDLYQPKGFIIEPKKPAFSNIPFKGMLYSMMMANHLKKIEEIRKGQRYRLVIKTRFDLVFQPGSFLSCEKIRPRNIYYLGDSNGFTSTDYENAGIDDVIFWGDSQSMDIACDTYKYFASKCIPRSRGMFARAGWCDPMDCYFSPGILIYQRAVRQNITFKSVDSCKYAIFRKGVEDLDPIWDYQKISRYHLSGRK